MAPPRPRHRFISRRRLLKGLGFAPVLLHPSPFSGLSLLSAVLPEEGFPELPVDFTDRVHPRYPARSPLEDVLRLVPPGSDEYGTERDAAEIGTILARWGELLRSNELPALKSDLDAALRASSFQIGKETRLRRGSAVECARREFSADLLEGPECFLQSLKAWLGQSAQAQDTRVERADFEITSVEEVASAPRTVRLRVRYDLVTASKDSSLEQRVGSCVQVWGQVAGAAETPAWKLQRWEAETETLSQTRGPVFVDVTRQALGRVPSYGAQMLRGSDDWRTVLDSACGIDVYGNNGVAAGDYDGDGFDDLYICQPAGLPNRLYRNRGDGTFEDVTERAGVGVLDNTSCALFVDFRNSGLQDLLVVCGSGPLLFLNQGNGTFQIKPDAFKFARPPQGTFTHAAVADYDCDGRLDIYFCLYSYYLGLDQYHYPVPYFDARNGPPNFLLHNEGDATFVDRTEAAGLNAENDRYSFACAWGETTAGGTPDLYVVNDFGRNNFYRNHGDGTFTAASKKSHVEDVGAGMSACWADVDNDGRADLYVSNMWSAAGQRISGQKRFHEKAPESTRDLYRRHARGNALYRNQGDGLFRNLSEQAGVEAGRWAWSSDFWDFDHDGYPDLYVTNGYISGPGQGDQRSRPSQAKRTQEARRSDLGSFFWRQVVAKSPDDSTPSLAYEHGWNALNELIRSDGSWSGYERNVMLANNRDGTFTEISGVAGMDFLEDGRSFALADLDHDGCLEVVVKNRNTPQLRLLKNEATELGDSIAFRFRGTRSNRDGIGTAITVESGELRQTRYLAAGTGFLAQHSKELFFGLGKSAGTVRAKVRWPGGLLQTFEALPRNSRILLVEGTPTVTVEAFTPRIVSTKEAAASPLASAHELNLLESFETWLLEPLRAPAFSLEDVAGRVHDLASERGSFVVLHFWATTSPASLAQVKLLNQKRSAFVAGQTKAFAVNLDSAEKLQDARSFAQKQAAGITVLFATDDVTGIYNIIYRYLFDRRRDLAVPSTFLLDRQGSIVKVYQGIVSPERLLEDTRSVPVTKIDRVGKALPFLGTLYHGDFSRNDFTYGVAMFQHGYLEEAANSFEQVVASRPNDAEGYYNLGTLNLRRNDLVKARKYLQQTLELRPEYPEAWNNLGMIAAQEGHAEEAIQSFEQSLSQRPTYAIALLNLGNVYRRQGNYVKAQDSLTRALTLQPDDPEANYSLGMLYAQQNQLRSAAIYLEKAVAVRPDYPEALNNLGVLSIRERDYVTAEQQFKTCMRLVPAFDQSYLNLAHLYLLQQDKRKATEVLEALIRLQPQSATAKQALEAVRAMP